jgi:hypothetical protein
MLESIGLITTDRTGRITVSFDGADNLQQTLDDLNSTLSLLNDLLLGLPPGTTIDLNVNGIAELNAGIIALRELRALVQSPISPDFDISDKFLSSRRFAPASGSINDLTSPPAGANRTAGGTTARAPQSLNLGSAPAVAEPVQATIIYDADTSQAEAERDELVADTNATTATMTIDGDEVQALRALGNAIDAANRSRGTVAIDGNVNPFYADINAINGRVLATAYVNVVAQQVGDFAGGLFRHGGVIPRAANGMVVGAAEVGPERFDFPGGGGFTAMTPGLYAAPRGTYIHTAPATRSMGLDRGSGISLTIPIYGNVYGIDDLTEKVTREIVPALVDAMNQQRRALGI